MVAGADTVVTYLMGLNPNWFSQIWQQGVAVIALLTICCIITLQPFRTVQNMANVMFGIILLTVIIVGVAGVAWFVGKHPSATSFSHPSDWWLTPTNFVVFGAITHAYLGVAVPMNMGGEILGRKVITRHHDCYYCLPGHNVYPAGNSRKGCNWHSLLGGNCRRYGAEQVFR